MNDSQLPLRCKKGEGYRMAAGDFVGYNQEPGAAPRPVVVKIGMWDARHTDYHSAVQQQHHQHHHIQQQQQQQQQLDNASILTMA